MFTTGSIDRRQTPLIYILIDHVMTGARGEGTATCDVTVHVTDVNDNSPRWSEPTLTAVSLPDNLEVGSVVISLTASDLDAGYNASVTYSLHAGQSVNGRFPESHFPGKTIPGKTFPGKTFPG